MKVSMTRAAIPFPLKAALWGINDLEKETKSREKQLPQDRFLENKKSEGSALLRRAERKQISYELSVSSLGYR